MLSVEPEFRRIGLGSILVKKTIDMFIDKNADEIEIETECCNIASLKLYERFGFIRKTLQTAYYVNGNDAFKLVFQVCLVNYLKGLMTSF